VRPPAFFLLLRLLLRPKRTMPVATEDFFKQVDEEEEKATKDRHRREDYNAFRIEFDTLKRTHSTHTANSDNLKEQGNQFFSLGCYEQASTIYSEALELRPDSEVLYCNRSMTYLKMELLDQALEDAEMSLTINATVTNIKAFWRKAQALLELRRYDDSEAAASAGLLLQPSNGHLNTVRRKAREAAVLHRLVGVEWVGKVQSGIEKRMTFTKDGVMTMYVFGHPVKATFELSVECNPRSMVVRMKMEGNLAGSGPPPPPTPYIFDFSKGDEELWLCHPVNTSELPSKFEGPGFDRMARTVCSTPEVDVDALEPVDDLCSQYILAMNDVLPLFPQQLPSRPSDDEIGHEVRIAEELAKLKRKYGVQVHRRAVDLAKDPASAGNDLLETQAFDLQKRFIARRIIADPQENAASSSSAPAPAAAAAAPAVPISAPTARLIGHQPEAAVDSSLPSKPSGQKTASGAPAPAGCFAKIASICSGS